MISEQVSLFLWLIISKFLHIGLWNAVILFFREDDVMHFKRGKKKVPFDASSVNFANEHIHTPATAQI